MPRVRFGVFDFDPASGELRREGVPVRLQAQPAQVLAVLLEHSGEVVTREQLRQAVWGADTFVDFDQGLNYCIAQIRGALGDSAESSRFVRTVPKRGYQFVAPVAPADTTDQHPLAAPRKTPIRKYAIAGAALAALLGGLAILVIASRARTINVAVARFDNETGNPAMDSFADGLSDTVVAEMTAADGAHLGIIGNAALLRRPRAERDLKAIATSLHASYVILGQVQRIDSKIRVLAHLIRLPEQTHVAVVRFDRDLSAPLETESELGKRIASTFLRQLGASPPPVSH